MPLHLLGKKSWNVYNADNIARVRRDEAEARAREEAEEQRLQEIDAERRLAILRGEVPLPLPDADGQDDKELPEESEITSRKGSRFLEGDRQRRKRKKPGEDDTEFEMRVAREQQQQEPFPKPKPSKPANKIVNAPLTDASGHISLFPDLDTIAPAKRQKKDSASPPPMSNLRFQDAAGLKADPKARPWYHGDSEEGAGAGRDVWGNEDPRRKERDGRRIVDADPLAAMLAGARKVREVEQERKSLNEEKVMELRSLREEDRAARRKKRKQRHEERHDHDDHERRHGHRHRSCSKERCERSLRSSELRRHNSERRYDEAHGKGRERVRSEGSRRREKSMTDHF